MRKEPLTDNYPAMLERLDDRTTSPGERTQLFLECVRAFVLRTRQGNISPPPTMDAEVRLGLAPLLSDSASERTRQSADDLRGSVAGAPMPGSIPGGTLDAIRRLWLERLHFECLRIFCRLEDTRTPQRGALLGAIEDRCNALKVIFANLPCPEGVARENRAISRRLFLEGSPLFGWWRTESDGTELALMTDHVKGGRRRRFHWDTAPSAIQGWDLESITRMFPVPGASSDDLNVQQSSLLPFTRHLGDENRRSVMKLFPSRTQAPGTLAAETGIVSAQAHFPFTVTEPRSVRLAVTSLGLREGVWHMDVRLDHRLSASETQNRILDRLTVRDPRTYRHVASAVTQAKARDAWHLEVPIRAVEGVSLLEHELPSKTADGVLEELLARAPGELFLWVLGESYETGSGT